MPSSLLYGRTVILLTGVNGWVLGSATTLTGSLMIISLSDWVDLSINRSSKVGTCSGWGATTFAVVAEGWWVTLPIYTTIQSKLRQCLYPFSSSLPHHSQTANVSLQSVLPITIINMSSNSIPLQSMSRWSLDSDDYDAHVNLWNQLHS